MLVVNTANLDNVNTLDGHHISRTDEFGYFIYRYTDDGGDTWSSSFYNISYRQTAIDRNNSFHGKQNEFWNGRCCRSSKVLKFPVACLLLFVYVVTAIISFCCTFSSYCCLARPPARL